jgi:hypothetical protein
MVCTIAQQQEQMAHILAKAIHARGLPIPSTTFPMSYTSLHDLDLRYVISRIHDAQRQLVEELQTLACALADDRPAHEIAVEALSQANEHLTLIEAAFVPGSKRRSTTQSDHTRGPKGKWNTEPTASRDALTKAARLVNPYNRADASVSPRKCDVGRYKSNLERLIANRSSSLPVEGCR